MPAAGCGVSLPAPLNAGPTMKPLARILVVCDHQMTRSPALHRGVELARKASAELHLCIFDYDAAIELAARRVDAGVARRARKEFLRERMTWLDREAADCAAHGLRVECDAIWAPQLDEAIVSKALEIKPDLVIKDVTVQSGVVRFAFLPRDWKLVRFCPGPLMLVAPGSDQLPKRILAGVDAWEEIPEPSTLNRAVVEAGLQIGLYSDAEVHVAAVAPIIPSTGSIYRQIGPAIDQARADHARAFREFAERMQVPGERRHSLIGDAALSLNDLSKRIRADLLVVGTHFRSGWTRLFLGSTAETLLNHAQCDVLLIKPAGVLEEITKRLGIPTGVITRKKAVALPGVAP